MRGRFLIAALLWVCPALASEPFETLTAHPHRLAGTEEGIAAGNTIESQLRALKGEFFQQRFSFPQQIVKTCELKTATAMVALQPLAANGLQLPVTPHAGIEGELIFIGKATDAELARKNLNGCIAVADFASRGAVNQAFRHGARAIIFLGDGTDTREWLQDKRTFVSADLPRFYLSREAAQKAGLLDGGRATIVSRMSWQKRYGRNLFLWIPGSEPNFKNGKEEFLILSAHYDSDGIVPHDAPAGESAANCAALLATARELASSPPRRSVLIAFFDNHANFLEGGRQFYAAYRRSIPERIEDSLPQRKTFVKQEREQVEQLLGFFKSPNLLTADHPRKDAGIELLRDEARFRYEHLQERLTELRLNIDRLRKANADVAPLQAKADQWAEEQQQWQKVRECIRDRRAPGPEANALFQTTVSACGDKLNNRLEELAELDQNLDDSIALTKPLANATPVLHASFRFTAGGTRWLFIPHGETHKKLYTTLITQAGKQESGFVWESKTSPESYLQWKTAEESDLADVFEIPSITLVTDQDKAPFAYMPGHRFSASELERIAAQASEFGVFLKLLANEEWASVPNRALTQRKLSMDDPIWSGGEVQGHMIKSFGVGQTSAGRPEANAVTHIMAMSLRQLQSGMPPGAVVNEDLAQIPEYYTFTDGNGCLPLNTIFPVTWRQTMIEAARFDDDGRITAITTARPGGPVASVSAGWEKAAYYWAKWQAGYYFIIPMFRGEGGRIIAETLPFAETFKGPAFTLLNGLSNSQYKRWHFRFDPLRGVGSYWIEKPLGTKFIYQDPQNQDNVALGINATPEKKAGTGFGAGSGEVHSDAVRRSPLGHGVTNGTPYGVTTNGTLDLQPASARDLFTLNESRLDVLRRKNIILNSLEYLHSQAKFYLGKLDEAIAANRFDEANILASTVGALEQRIYRPVISTTNDMIVAVTVLLLLAIPFAFSVQSLLFATHSVYRRIAGFALVFLATFATLYFVHPAFSFASTPLIIILAFIVMVMAGGVIGIISNKFTFEIKKLQGMASATHTFSSSAIGNLGAAVALAISTMRRRPARTALTAATVLLLTFTILSFVSVQTEQGMNRFYLGVGDRCSRMLLHRKIWKSMDRHTLAEVRASLRQGFITHGIYWRTRELGATAPLEDLRIPVASEAGKSASASAILSLDEREIACIPGLREMLPEKLDDFLAGRGVFLPKSLADELGLKSGDRIRIQGEDLVFAGAFDSRRLLAMRHLDGAPFVPINFGLAQLAVGKVESKGSAGAGDAQSDLEDEIAKLEPQALEPVSPDSLILAPTQLEGPLRMSLKGIVVYPEQGRDMETTADRLATLFQDGVYLNQGGEVSLFFYGAKYGVTGTSDVLIPLLLGGLIIFSTMLGSVIDREREIYTFSALGLAPRVIAGLFFVEAGIYAVLGGFGGYLFSQVVTRVLEVLASFGWFKAPEMNYSSSTAIQTILIVMATVMVSTIYPAIQAARKATADTRSRWRVPAPKADLCSFDFPFTISSHHITGILCFLREHFANNADRTVGKFAVDKVELFREPTHGIMAIRAAIWLQPFDQGISQQFELTARPSDIEEVCEIHVQMERRSGPPSAWQRSNVVFLEDLRLQFLLWRTLDDESMDHYLAAAEQEENEVTALQTH